MTDGLADELSISKPYFDQSLGHSLFTDPAGLASFLDADVRNWASSARKRIITRLNVELSDCFSHKMSAKQMQLGCALISAITDIRSAEIFLDVPELIDRLVGLLTGETKRQWSLIADSIVRLSRLADENVPGDLISQCCDLLLDTDSIRFREAAVSLLSGLLSAYPELSSDDKIPRALRNGVCDTDKTVRKLSTAATDTFFGALRQYPDGLETVLEDALSFIIEQMNAQNVTSQEEYGALATLQIILKLELLTAEQTVRLRPLVHAIAHVAVKQKVKRRHPFAETRQIAAAVLPLLAAEDIRTGVCQLEEAEGVYILQSLKEACNTGIVDRASAFLALGDYCEVLPQVAGKNIEDLMQCLLKFLNPSSTSTPFVPQAVTCVRHLFSAIPTEMKQYIQPILDVIFSSGLTSNLQNSLSALVKELPQLLPYIQSRLLDHVSYLLAGVPLSYAHVSVAPFVMTDKGVGFRSSGLGDTDILMVSHTMCTNRVVASQILSERGTGSWAAGVDFTPPSVDTRVVQPPTPGSQTCVRYALRMLIDFDLTGYNLVDFTTNVVSLYLDSPETDIRRLATLACCRILSITKLTTEGHIGLMTGALLSRLILIAVADSSSNIRELALDGLMQLINGQNMDICATYLVQPEVVTQLSKALYDLKIGVRVRAIQLLCTIAHYNPGCTLAPLRRLVVHLIAEIEHSVNRSNTATLLSALVRSASDLLVPYVTSLLDTLLRYIEQSDLSPPIVNTIGTLMQVADPTVVARHVPVIQQLFINALSSPFTKVQFNKVVVETLGKLISYAGVIVRPQLNTNSILKSLIRIVAQNPSPELRFEAIRGLGFLGAVDESRISISQTADEGETKLPQILISDSLEIGVSPYRCATRIACATIVDVIQVADSVSLFFYACNALVYVLTTDVIKLQPEHQTAVDITVRRLLELLMSETEAVRFGRAQLIEHLALIVAAGPINVRHLVNEITSTVFQLVEDTEISASVLRLIEQLAQSLPDDFRPLLTPLMPRLSDLVYRCSKDIMDEELIIELTSTLHILAPRSLPYAHILVPALCNLLSSTSIPTQKLTPFVNSLAALCRVSAMGLEDFTSPIVHSLIHVIQTRVIGKNGADEVLTPLKDAIIRCFLDLTVELGTSFSLYVPSIFQTLSQAHMSSPRLSSAIAHILRGAAPPDYLLQGTDGDQAPAVQTGAARILQLMKLPQLDVSHLTQGMYTQADYNNFINDPTTPHIDVSGVSVPLYKLLFLGVDDAMVVKDLFYAILNFLLVLRTDQGLTSPRTGADASPRAPAYFDVPERITDQVIDDVSRTVIEKCPAVLIRALGPLAVSLPRVRETVVPVAFTLTFYYEQSSRSRLSDALRAVIQSSMPPSAARRVLTFAEALEHNCLFVTTNRPPYPQGAADTIEKLCRLPVPAADEFTLDRNMLSQLSEKCQAYAKALHHQETLYIEILRDGSAYRYREREEHETVARPERDPGCGCIETLIATENQLHLGHAARGLLIHARILGLDQHNIRESWLEELHFWGSALYFYRNRKLSSGVLSQESSIPLSRAETLVDSRAALGELRCLIALSDHQQCLDRAEEMWALAPHAVRQSIARYASISALHLHNMDSLERFLQFVPKSDFTYSLCMGVLLASHGDFQGALKQAETARSLLDPRLRLLVSDSYSRAYDSLINVQQIAELEEAVNTISLPPQERGPQLEVIKRIWRERLSFVKRSADVWDDILAVRRIAVGPRDDVPVFLTFAGICIQENKLNLSFSVLSQLINRDVDRLAEWKQPLERSPVSVVRDNMALPFINTDELFGNIIVTRGVAWPHHPSKRVTIDCAALNILQLRIENRERFMGHVRPKRTDILDAGTIRLGQSPRVAVIDGGTVGEMPVSCTISDVIGRHFSIHHFIPTVAHDPNISQSPGVEFMYIKHEWAMGRRLSAFRRLSDFISRLVVSNSKPEPTELMGSAATPQPSQPSHERRVGSLFANFDFTRDELTAQALIKLGDWAAELRNDINVVIDPDLHDLIHSEAFELSLVKYATVFEPQNSEVWRRAASSTNNVMYAVTTEISRLKKQRQCMDAKPAQLTGSEEERLLTDAALLDARICALKQHRNTLQADVIADYVSALQNLGNNESMLADTLQLFAAWVELGEQSSAESAIQRAVSLLPVSVWIAIIPQIIARMHTHYVAVRRVIQSMLILISRQHPQALIFPLTVAQQSSSVDRQADARSVMQQISEHYPLLVEQARIISKELNRVSIFWSEQWHEVLDRASVLLFQNNDAESMLQCVHPLHMLLMKPAETQIEQSFIDTYGAPLNEAYQNLRNYAYTHRQAYMYKAWSIYMSFFQEVTFDTQFKAFELDSASPALCQLRDIEVACPDFYEPNVPLVRIQRFEPHVEVMQSKQRPRKIYLVGSDGRERTYLLKGHEDLRQDERAMQLFLLMNHLLAADPSLGRSGMRIVRYAAVPLSPHTGLICWVSHTDTLSQLVATYRNSRGIPPNEEHHHIMTMDPSYDKEPFFLKLEMFERVMRHTRGDDLHHILWLRAASSEQWLQRRLAFTKAIALTSMVGYILGLGDRHPQNIMIHRRSGVVVHIDFGDSFEVAQHRDYRAETVPFRLTRVLVRAFGASGVEGDFRLTAEAVMHLIRSHGSSVLAALEAFVHDPLLSWLHFSRHRGKVGAFKHVFGQMPKNLHEMFIKCCKNQREQMTVERDALPDEQLHEEAARHIARIKDKLSGCDFDVDTVGPSLGVPDQVSRLIRQATAYESLVRLYFGWVPSLQFEI